MMTFHWKRGVLLLLALTAVLTTIVFATVVYVPAEAQTATEPTRTYRLIRTLFDDTVTTMRWIELWENEDPTTGSRELVMVQANGSSQGVDDTCSYVNLKPTDVPVYVVAGVRQQVTDANTAWTSLPNRNVLDSYRNFAATITCDAPTTETVNGVEAGKCSFTDVAANSLFLVRPPATASGERWLTTASSAPLKYTMTVDGSDSVVYSRYEVLTGGEGLAPAADVRLMCFEEPFPVAPDLTLLTSDQQTGALFDTIAPLPTIQQFYTATFQLDQYKTAGWVASGQPDEARQSFLRTYASGEQCRVDLLYTPASGVNAATVEVEILPDYMLKRLQFAADNQGNISVASSATNAQILEAMNVPDAVAKYQPTFEAEGWTLRPDLTDISRDDSAFVTLERDNYQLHIIVEGTPGRSFVRIQTRTKACGPTFKVP